MGAAGRRRAREVVSWPVIVGQYNQLFSELEEQRLLAGEAGTSASAHRMNPLRGDPFTDFRGHPGAVLHDALQLRLAPAAEPDALGPDPAMELDQMFPGLRGSAMEAREVVSLLQAAGSLPVRDVLRAFPPGRRPFVRMSLVWLAKSGVVDWLPTD
jgi:hypothetical protein